MQEDLVRQAAESWVAKNEEEHGFGGRKQKVLVVALFSGLVLLGDLGGFLFGPSGFELTIVVTTLMALVMLLLCSLSYAIIVHEEF